MDAKILDYAFFKGEFVPFSEANVSIGTHALQYGTGAFAGIRGYLDADGSTINIVRLPDHAERLLNSGKLLRAELPYGKDDVVRIISDLTEMNAPSGDIYIRPFIYKPAVQLTPRLRGIGDELAVYQMPMGDYLSMERGQKAVVSSWVRIPDAAIPSRGKLTGAYVNSALAKDEATENGADEAIMMNTAGKIAEGTGCNLFIVRHDKLITAPFSSDILEGMTRRSIMKMAKSSGIDVEVREIDRTELYLADEAFFCGTGVQVAWIESIDGRVIGNGKVGPVTDQLRTLYFDMVRGKLPQYSHWLTQVKIPQVAMAG